MKYLIDYNNETKGGGSWTSFCPICGLHFRIDFNLFEYIIKEYEKFYKYKLSPEKKRLWKKNKDKIISNFHKFKKIEKYTFSEYNTITLLLPNSIVKHGVKYYDSNEFFSKKINYDEVYFDNPSNDDNGTKGLPMHTECWNLAKNKLKHELKFEDFLFNKNTSKILDNYAFESIKYGTPIKYFGQHWNGNLFEANSNAFLLNEKDWYMLYLPSGKTIEAQKNSKRITTILKKIIKGIKKPILITKKLKKDRPSPSESATEFKEGTKKKGNDGNMYIIVINKNGVKRWKKL